MELTLDTLAQLDQKRQGNRLHISNSKTLASEKKQAEFSEKHPIEWSKAPFRKRARSKAFMDSIIYQLIDLNSPFKNAYWSTYHCTRVILQEGTTTTSKYCKQRWCKTCNNIRTANLINGYREPLSKLKNPYFVTLTIPNVEGQRLKQSIEGMTKTFAIIKRSVERKNKTKLRGIRKTECTISKRYGNYHPHFHIIIDGKENAQSFHNEWLKRYPETTQKGQHIEQATEGTLQELFKYFTKLITQETFYAEKMDIIFRAMKNKRVYQAFGLKKQVSEEIEDIERQQVIHLGNEPAEIYVWNEEARDWISNDGVVVADYNPSQKYLEYLDKLKPQRE